MSKQNGITTVTKILIFVICLMLCSCKAQDTQTQNPIIETVASDNYKYHYVIDHKTNNVYLLYTYGRKSALGIVLNPDGTPMTIDQLGEK